MTGGFTFQDFVTQTMGEFGTIPKRGLIYVTVASMLSAITDLIYWGNGANYSDLYYALQSVVIFLWLVAAYATTMSMVKKPPSFIGFVKFTAAYIITSVPILFSFAVLVYYPRAGLHDSLTIYIFIMVFIFGFLFAAFLPAWPIAQAISTRFISPMQIIKATKGYRWSLILVLFSASSVNKLVPSMSSATNIGEAIALALCGAVVAAATLILTASIAVTAWKFALRRDTRFTQL